MEAEGMTRRSLFASLLATAAMDPEKLLWVPGKKFISVPKPRPHIFYLPNPIRFSPKLKYITLPTMANQIDGGRVQIIETWNSILL